jgi:hypothetical protein
MRSLMICTLIQYFSGDQIEKSEMGRSCSTYGWRGEVYTGFRWGKPGGHGRKILRWIFMKWDVRA